MFGPESFAGAPYGDYYKFMRKLLVMNLFCTQALERSRAIRVDELERFYENLLDKARKEESVEISKEVMKLTNNSICRMLMGRSFSEENDEASRVRGSVKKTMGLLGKVVLSNTLGKPLKKLGISLFGKEIRRVSHGFDELLERMLREHEDKKPEKHQVTDLMDVLLAVSRDENAEYKITKNHIKLLLVVSVLSFHPLHVHIVLIKRTLRLQFQELLLGGTDSAAHVVQWAMAEIIRKPRILERLRQEIDSVVEKTRLIQEGDLPRLPYLQAVVKETLRLHPAVPVLVRMFEQECMVGGFCIPEKTTLLVNVYAVMRDPDIWEEPNEFKPERFLASSRSDQEEREQAIKYLPFGSGRRVCPGLNLGSIFVGTAVGMMVQCFDWRNKGDEVVNMEDTIAGITMTMAHPLKCTHLPRTDPSTSRMQIPSSQL